jgi:hypothetical protein
LRFKNLKLNAFGYWRFTTARFSRQWMMAVHIPVPFVLILRILSGFGWNVIPLLMLSFAVGQLAGGRLRKFNVR